MPITKKSSYVMVPRTSSQKQLMKQRSRNDDRASVSSTFTAETPSGGLRKQSSQRRQGMKRNVRFEEDSNVFFDNVLYCQEEVDQFWYDEDHYDRFKRETVEAVHKIWELEEPLLEKSNSYLNVLEDVYETCCCVHSDDDHVFTTILQDNAEQLEQLRALFRRTRHVQRIGLEKIVAEDMKMDANERRQRLVQMVDNIQHGITWKRYADMAQTLQKASQNLSRAQRLFSHLLAQAQRS